MNSWLTLLCLFVGVCSQCSSNCLLCLSGTCVLCQPGYALTLSAVCTARSVANCRLYSSATSCQLCEATFQHVNGTCVKDYSGCVSRTVKGSCNFCTFGTVLSENTCKGVLNCQVPDVKGQCQRCLKGYVLESGSCVDNRSECASRSAGVCTQCGKDYIMNGFSCMKAGVVAPNCELYDAWAGRCMVCRQGYQMQFRFCLRLDQLSPLGGRSPQKTVQNALAMPTDTLYDSPTKSITNAPDLLPLSYGFSLEIFNSAGTSSQEGCWLKAADDSCRVCRQGFILSNGSCTASALCLKYAADGKSCSVCNVALVLDKGWCSDVNCAVSIFSRCSVCKLSAYKPNAEGICVNAGCSSLVGGKCLACSSGLSLDANGLCAQSTISAASTPAPTATPPKTQLSTNATSSIPNNCDIFQNGNCVRCKTNYFPDDAGVCKRVIIGCLQMDKEQQNCVQCLSIYSLDSKGGCQFGPPATTPTTPPAAPAAPTVPTTVPFAADANCDVLNKGSCAVCKVGFVLNLYNFSCIPVAKQCASYNTTDGSCLSCASPFNLFNGWCLPRATAIDPNCLISTIRNYCSSCKPTHYLDRGACKPNNPLCKTSQPLAGACLSCYSGYVLFNSNCVSVAQQAACMTYDFSSVCSQCYNRFWLNSGVCLPISPLCYNYNASTGQCIDCIAGYGLSSITGKCEYEQAAPPNCLKGDPTGKCLTCNPRYFTNASGMCQAVAALCQNYIPNGKCTVCFPTYKLLTDGSCLSTKLTSGCTSANSNGNCQSCLPQYLLTLQGSCFLRDPNCLNYTNVQCRKCVPLYYLSAGSCLKQTPKNKDPNCLINDIYNYCQQCMSGYYIFQGNCALADQNCKTFDPANGDCLSCYDGYRLNNNKCFLNNPIFNCQLFNGIVCAQCESGYKSAPDGSCTPI